MRSQGWEHPLCWVGCYCFRQHPLITSQGVGASPTCSHWAKIKVLAGLCSLLGALGESTAKLTNLVSELFLADVGLRPPFPCRLPAGATLSS